MSKQFREVDKDGHPVGFWYHEHWVTYEWVDTLCKERDLLLDVIKQAKIALDQVERSE